MNRKIRTIIAALAATLCCSVALTGVASAQETQTLTIHYNGDGFDGKLSASKQCRKNRTVDVYKKRPGNDQRLYMDTTDNKGNWNTGNSGQAHGKFYAAARGNNNCGPVTSQTISV